MSKSNLPPKKSPKLPTSLPKRINKQRVIEEQLQNEESTARYPYCEIPKHYFDRQLALLEQQGRS